MVSFITQRCAQHGHRNLHGSSRPADTGQYKAKVTSTQPKAAAAAAAAVKPDAQPTQGRAKARDPPTKTATTAPAIKPDDAAAVSAALTESDG